MEHGENHDHIHQQRLMKETEPKSGVFLKRLNLEKYEHGDPIQVVINLLGKRVLVITKQEKYLYFWHA